ncbi:hypothetical protein [Thiomonas arsenitoxydans]|nr:hypothetical protein [Thiomonas arsenitoxydans]
MIQNPCKSSGNSQISFLHEDRSHNITPRHFFHQIKPHLKIFQSHITLMALAGLACACLFQAFIFIKEILMTIACPVCKSLHIKTLDRGRDAGTVIGATGGAAAGLMAAVGGAETGAALGAVAGPVGIAVGGLTGALLGGLFGAAAGGAAGRAVGTAVDERLLENLECQHCGLQFSGRDLD